MKKLLALTLATLVSVPVFAQGGESGGKQRHMLEFNAQAIPSLILSFDKNKTKNQKSDNDTHWRFSGGYAYRITDKVQLGTRLLYNNDVNEQGDFENYGVQVGAIYNLSDDLMNSLYGSAYVGYLWNKQYEGVGDDEVRSFELAIGKRFDLDRWGIKHITYSPEIALSTRNSTTSAADSSFDYSQDLQFRVLQFSAFW